MRDPLAGSSWSAPTTVEGFRTGRPNPELMHFAGQELARIPAGTLVDLGCGAGRNAVPLAEMGWHVVATDLSWPMLRGAAEHRPREVRGDDMPAHFGERHGISSSAAAEVDERAGRDARQLLSGEMH